MNAVACRYSIIAATRVWTQQANGIGILCDFFRGRIIIDKERCDIIIRVLVAPHSQNEDKTLGIRLGALWGLEKGQDISLDYSMIIRPFCGVGNTRCFGLIPVSFSMDGYALAIMMPTSVPCTSYVAFVRI